MLISISFILILMFLNESMLNKDGISPQNQIDFREMVTNQKNLNFLARPYAFRKMVKNKTNAKQKDQKFFNYECAWSQEPLTLEHLNQVCGLRKDNSSFDSYDYENFAKTAKIVNGTDAELGEWPWLASLTIPSNENRTKFQGCGGALITDADILTAAHCFPDFEIPASSIIIELGGIWEDREEEHKKTFRALDYTTHEDYNSDGSLSDDIALIRLEEKVQFDCYIAPVCLPFPPEPFIKNKLAQVKAWVAGYGRLEENGATPGYLKHVQLTLLSNEDCRKNDSTILPSQICTYEKQKDTCQGDSGGPVVIRYEGQWTTVGAVSYGRGCAQTVGVNTRITSYESWIKYYVDIFDEDKRSTRALSKK